ncbi:MAG: asparagine synthase (glutamine-hydrolyzing) [Myxococcales bacterium]|nr:asparagine synthase (glutamine-hydrolyzing) [Myxococcales bacterium]
MCGISGVVLPHGQRPEGDVIAAMTARLAHRGPDGEGLYIDDGCALGHRRLAIVDLSPNAAQPMASDDGDDVLVFNGEIYDFKALRRELEGLGERFRSQSDTECLLVALRRWGVEALSKIHGMFAFAWWQRKHRTLTLGRDRFGKKPLYIACFGDGTGSEGLAFASELRALMAHPRVHDERTVDPVAVAQYLVHEYVPAPHAIVSNVRKLRPGEVAVWRETTGLLLETYWSPRFDTRMHGSVAALREGFLSRVDAAVRRRLVADVPVGIFLSGGLDSSLVAALAVRHHPKIKTFAVGFENASFDERAHAAQVAEHLGTDHHVEVLSEAALIDAVLPTLDWLDEPHADSSILPTSLLAAMARREVTVALGGDGGDEILAGYPTFVADKLLGALPPSAVLGALIGRAARLAPQSDANFSLAFKLRQMAQGVGSWGAERHARWLAAIDPEVLPALMTSWFGEAPQLALAHAQEVGLGQFTNFDAATAFYLRSYLAEGVLQKVDRATMRASLEARAPLLDTEVVSYCLSLPESVRLRGTSTKWLMREALRGLVPEAILARPKKGFGAPVGQWLRGPLRTFLTDTLSPRAIARSGWFNPRVVGRWIDEHLAGTADHRKPLYTLLVLEHWRARWMETP